MQKSKQNKRIRWVNIKQFNILRQGKPIELDIPPNLKQERTILKNQINRLNGSTAPTTDEETWGYLYTVDELAFVDKTNPIPTPHPIAIYVKAANPTWANQAKYWLEQLALSGYGARKSVGYGQSSKPTWERFEAFDKIPTGANGFIRLSNWVPARQDPTEGFYKTFVKQGKLGEELARSNNPFKLPLLMLKAGSSFYTNTPSKAWYGRLVQNIAPHHKKVVQHGYAFAIPAYLTVL